MRGGRRPRHTCTTRAELEPDDAEGRQRRHARAQRPESVASKQRGWLRGRVQPWAGCQADPGQPSPARPHTPPVAVPGPTGLFVVGYGPSGHGLGGPSHCMHVHVLMYVLLPAGLTRVGFYTHCWVRSDKQS